MEKRIIKFRAWQYHIVKECWEMFGWERIKRNSMHYLWETYTNRIIMQFTGIYDKNGVEVYEGDIVKIGGGVASIVWKDAGFALYSPGSEAIDWVMMDFIPNNDKLIVVGNIYENPDWDKQ